MIIIFLKTRDYFRQLLFSKFSSKSYINPAIFVLKFMFCQKSTSGERHKNLNVTQGRKGGRMDRRADIVRLGHNYMYRLSVIPVHDERGNCTI